MGLDTFDAHEFLALVLRVTPRLVTSLIRRPGAFPTLALVACGVGQKLVVHHLASPRPVKQGDREAVLKGVLAGQFSGGPAGLLAGQQARIRIERRPKGEKAPQTAGRHLHRVGVLQASHAA
jgi:hypothetical protein